MTVRDLGAEYGFDDADDGWFGAAQPVDEAPPPPPQPAPPPRQAPAPQPPPPPRPAPPTPPRPAPPAPPRQEFLPPIEDDSDPDTDRWLVEDMNAVAPAEPEELAAPEAAQPARADERPHTESVAATLNVVPTRRNGFVRAPAPSSWESRLANSGAWEFKSKSASAPFPKRAVLTAAAVLVGVAAVVGVVVLVLRSPADGESSPVAPSESSAPPAPSTSAPVASTAAPLPPPPPVLAPPPPPPPPPAEVAPPVVTRQYQPSYQTPDPPKKPQQNVTRAPMSAAPPPPPPRPTDGGRATPGQSGSHGFFG